MHKLAVIATKDNAPRYVSQAVVYGNVPGTMEIKMKCKITNYPGTLEPTGDELVPVNSHGGSTRYLVTQ